jgi:thymidylate synthase (FAD)
MRRTAPKVFLIGETKLNPSQLNSYFDHIKTKWRPQSGISDAELLIEMYGRMCYRSWEPGMNVNVKKIREGNDVYLGNIINSRHGSVMEHSVTNWIFADVSRVFTHELVRHRVGTAFSQESLRYVRLTDLGLWLPPEIENDPVLVEMFEDTFVNLEELQLKMAEHLKLDEMKSFHKKKMYTSAMRRIAPIGLATTIGVSLNFRSLRHIGEIRTSGGAEVEVREVVDQIMTIATKRWPNAFGDFERNEKGEWTTPNSKI